MSEEPIQLAPTWTMEVDTPEAIAEQIIHNMTYTGSGRVDEVDYPDLSALAFSIATAIRNAYELAAVVCDKHAEDRQKRMDGQREHGYFEDMRAAYEIAAIDIRKLKGGSL